MTPELDWLIDAYKTRWNMYDNLLLKRLLFATSTGLISIHIWNTVKMRIHDKRMALQIRATLINLAVR